MDDLFKRFFGLGEGRFHDDVPGANENRSGRPDDDFNGRDGFFDRSDSSLDGMFDHFHRDMFQQMESIFRQMDDMMKGFGAADFPSDNFQQPPIAPSDPSSSKENPTSNVFVWTNTSPFFRHGPDSSKQSPRDFMLKDDEKDDSRVDSVVPVIPKREDRGSFKFPRFGRQRPEKIEDTDLDGKMSDANILDLIKRPSERSRVEIPDSPNIAPVPRERPNRMFSSQSVSVSTFTGPDGKVEHKRVVRDSSGREESTVTRSIGDKSHTVTTIKDDAGSQRHENLQNMDEGELSKFESLWSKTGREPMLTPRQHPSFPFDPSDQSLFFKLFGRGGK